LLKAGEILGLRLNTIHNLHFLLDWMRRIRAAILEGTLGQLKASFLAHYTPAHGERQRRADIKRRRKGS
jgi:queuine tRNA-ribosyltransferase